MEFLNPNQILMAELVLSGLSYTLDTDGNVWVWNIVWERWTKLDALSILKASQSI